MLKSTLFVLFISFGILTPQLSNASSLDNFSTENNFPSQLEERHSQLQEELSQIEIQISDFFSEAQYKNNDIKARAEKIKYLLIKQRELTDLIKSILNSQ